MAITINETPRQRRALQAAADAYNATQAGVVGFVPLTLNQYADFIFTPALKSIAKQYLSVSGGNVAFSLTNAERSAIATLAGTNAEVAELLKQLKAGSVDPSEDATAARIALLVSGGAMTQARVDTVFG